MAAFFELYRKWSKCGHYTARRVKEELDWYMEDNLPEQLHKPSGVSLATDYPN